MVKLKVGLFTNTGYSHGLYSYNYSNLWAMYVTHLYFFDYHEYASVLIVLQLVYTSDLLTLRLCIKKDSNIRIVSNNKLT